MLGVVSFRDREGRCFCTSACFEKPPDAAFLKINTLTLGRFYASFFFSFFLQAYLFPSGYNCLRLSKFTSNKPWHKGFTLGSRFIKSTNTSALTHTATDEHEMWSGKFIIYSTMVLRVEQTAGHSNLDTTMWPIQFASQAPVCTPSSLITSVCMTALSRRVKILSQTWWISMNTSSVQSESIRAARHFACFGSSTVGLKWNWKHDVEVLTFSCILTVFTLTFDEPCRHCSPFFL